MKFLKRMSFATALICATALLIAAFILLFSYAGCSPTDNSIENVLHKMPVTTQPNVELANKTENNLAWY